MSSLTAASANTLFDTRVRRIVRLSARFVRVTLGGPSVHLMAANGLDLRVKLLIPRAPGYPPEFDPDLVAEVAWRRLWRSCDAHDRPHLRSYTVAAARHEAGEIDVDFYLHHPSGPASAWAVAATPGQRMLVSAPDSRLSTPTSGVQWRPGAARSVLIAGDDTAFPAIAQIARSLPAETTARILVEADEGADVSWLTDRLRSHSVAVYSRGATATGDLHEAVTAWTGEHGEAAAAMGSDFYAWIATESSRLAALRALLRSTGIAADRVHSQGYWNAGPRASES